MAAPTAITELVRRFHEHHHVYTSGAYNETQLRREFLDPFFEALGWDVFNKQGFAEAYKDVIHEDAIKVGAFTKAPDYCFRVGGTRKFFVEAKKPSVNVKDDLAPAFQVRRYAWSAKLPLSILTDFEEFAVYDCRVKPDKADKASTARIMYLTYTEFEKRWDEIAAIFSKDAVLKGSFDKYAQAVKGKKGTAEVDAAFLHEIEGWREVLARNIALRNSQLSQRELNFAVQQTIDRIIFLRICEDRGMEQEGKLAATTNGANVYKRLCELFRLADNKYNSGLFHFRKEQERGLPDEMTLGLEIDDKPLKDIIRGLYYPDCPYEFSVISSDILGQVYEQFLGKVIRLTDGHRAVVEDKPEVKKAGGVFYTPNYIADYIVKNTVGKLLGGQGSGVGVQGKELVQSGRLGKAERAQQKFPQSKITPREAALLRIIDISCGSGSFLITAYQYLLDWHLAWYVANNPQKYAAGKNPALYQGNSGDWKLTLAERKRILLDNIYGVDIDPQAVEVTKLSLLLKVLEGESEQSVSGMQKLIHTRVLPDLDRNIKCGNSLIGPDFYAGRQTSLFNDEERLRINVFDWKAEFPDIMKSGGFDAVIGNPPYGAELQKGEIDYLLNKFKVQNYQLDTYLLFLEKSLERAKDCGFVGVIIPNTWLLNLQGDRIRQHFFTETNIENIVHYRYPVFSQATVDTEVIIFRNTIPSDEHQICITVVNKDGSNTKYCLPQLKWKSKNGKPVNIFERKEFNSIIEKLTDTPRLDSVLVVTQGAKPFQVGKGKPPQTRKIVDEKPYVLGKKGDITFRPLLRGSLMHRYKILWKDDYWISFGDWLAEPRYSAHYDAPVKIIIRQTGDSLIATLDNSQFVVRDNLYTIIPRNDYCDLRYVLGLLNSRLLSWFYQKSINPEKGEALAQVKRGHIAQLPIHCVGLSNIQDKARHDRMVEMVEQMLALNKQLAITNTIHEKTALQRQIDATDRQIDQLVYELYGLTDEEIKIVEG